jgi:hypothetical protein
MLAWAFKSQPELGSQPFDGMVLTEFILRAPLDGQSGGEVAVVCTRDGKPEKMVHRFALEPGIAEKLPDALSKELYDWLVSLLQEKGLLPDGAAAAPRPAPTPTPAAPAPPGFGGTLG